LSLQSATGATQVSFTETGDSHAYSLVKSADNSFAIQEGSTKRLNIDSTGNFQLDTNKVTVGGDAAFVLDRPVQSTGNGADTTVTAQTGPAAGAQRAGGKLVLSAGLGGAATANTVNAGGGGALQITAGKGGLGAAGVQSGAGGDLELNAGLAGDAAGTAGTAGSAGTVKIGATSGAVDIAADSVATSEGQHGGGR
jgi:hypothetical protein